MFLPKKVKPLEAYIRGMDFPPGMSLHKRGDFKREQGIVPFKFRIGYDYKHDPLNPVRWIKISDYTNKYTSDNDLAWLVFDKARAGNAKFSSGEPLRWNEETHLYLFNKRDRQPSVLELLTETALIDLKINYECQISFPWCMIGYRNYRYDFCLPDYKLLIEVDGKQHEMAIDYYGGEEGFKIQQERDFNKERLAVENGYHFLRISFEQFCSNEKPLTEFLKSIILEKTKEKEIVQ